MSKEKQIFTASFIKIPDSASAVAFHNREIAKARSGTEEERLARLNLVREQYGLPPVSSSQECYKK